MSLALSDQTIQLRLERARALCDLARIRLGPLQRDEVVRDLEAAAADVSRQVARQPEMTAYDRQVLSEMVAKADAKAAQAEADRQEKRRPYEADPLFMYLWRRRFGTQDYRAGGLTRFFDRKVAHLIDYERARVNYTMLMDLPERLREHAESLRQDLAQRGAGTSPISEAAGAARCQWALQRLAEVEAAPAVKGLLQEAGRNARPEEQALLRRIEEIDAALSGAGRP